MSALRNHLEKVLFGVVLVACAVFGYCARKGSEADTKQMAVLEACRRQISSELQKTKVSPDYAYSAEAAARVKYWETFNANFARRTWKIEGEVPPWVAYPVLPRPCVSVNPGSNLPTEHRYAEVLPLQEVKAESDHGRIFVSLRLPRKTEYMDVVRIEVFRGEDEENIPLDKPYGTLGVGPEESPESSAAGRSTSQCGGVRIFPDTRVEPRKVYFYKARLIARMASPAGRRIEVRDAAGRLLKLLVIHAPMNAVALPGAEPNVVLYAGALSQTASATTLDNFQIRFAGLTGKIDPSGVPDDKRAKDYRARFAVRVWITEAQMWKEKTLEAAPGESLKGTLIYRLSASGDNTAYHFDSGYRLLEVKWGEIVRETEVQEPQFGPDGRPLINEVGRPVTSTVTRESQPIPNEVAVLEDLRDKKLLELPKRGCFEKKK